MLIRKSILLGLAVSTAFTVAFSTRTDAKVLFEWNPTKSNISGDTLKCKQKAVGKLQQPAKYDKEGLLIFENNQHILIDEKFAKKIPDNSFTVEALVRIDKPNAWGGIIGYSQDNGNYEKGWILGFTGSSYSIKASIASKLTIADHGKQFSPGQWAHITGVYDGKTLKLYTDGVLSRSIDLKGKIAPVGMPTPFVIGAYKDKDEFFPMEGRIKMIRIHDKALDHKLITKSAREKEYRFAVRPAVSFTGTDEAVVSWEATQAGQGAIAYGKTKNFEHVAKSTSKGTTHSVKLKNLEPATTYYYSLAATVKGKKKISPVYELTTTMNNTLPSAPSVAELKPSSNHAALAKNAITAAAQKDGYCVVYGLTDGKLAYEIARQSRFVVIAIDEDAERANKIRQQLYKSGVYGTRIMVQTVEDIKATPITSNFANLIVTERGSFPAPISEIKRILRPFSVIASASSISGFAKSGNVHTYTKPAIKDAHDWGHQYGNTQNTSNVNDNIGGATTTAELDIQWIGLPGGDFGVDRSPRMPAPLATNGRLFHQGKERMVALDSYNGKILWSLEIPDLRRVNIPHDSSNWCADKKHVYVAIKDRAWVLDAATGKRVNTLKLTSQVRGTHDWGFIGTQGNYVVGSSVKGGSHYTEFWGGHRWYDAAGDRQAIAQVTSDNIFAYNKTSGKGLWAYGKGSIINSTITITEDKIYFLENRNPTYKKNTDAKINENALWTKQLYAVCLNMKTGRVIWNKPFPKLKYVDEKKGFVQVAYGLYTHDAFTIVLSQGKHGTKTGVYSYHVLSGDKGELKWQAETAWRTNHHGSHMQHPVVVQDSIYCEPTGVNALTGKPLDHKYGPRSGCSAAVGSKDSLFFRGIGSCITQWGIKDKRPTHWQRLRPSCWLNFFPSNGMLLVPEGGAGCSCGGWMETSIGFSPLEK